MGFRERAKAGVSDHGELTGLADDDHTQYFLVDGTRTFTKTAAFDEEIANVSSAGTSTIDWTNGNKQKITLSENISTFNFTNPAGTANLVLKIIQDSTARTITWASSVKWVNGTIPTLSAGNGDIDIVTFYFDGTNYHGVISQGFS